MCSANMCYTCNAFASREAAADMSFYESCICDKRPTQFMVGGRTIWAAIDLRYDYQLCTERMNETLYNSLEFRWVIICGAVAIAVWVLYGNLAQ